MNTISSSQRETVKIRKRVGSLRPNSVVTVYLESKDGIYISPYLGIHKQNSKWNEIWHKIKVVRSFRSKTGNLSDFIIKDRENLNASLVTANPKHHTKYRGSVKVINLKDY